MQERIAVIAAFSLLSACVAPVSWQHAYAIAFFMLAVMWRRAFEERSSLFSLLLVFASTLAICSISFTSLGRELGPPYLVAYLAPIFGILLCIQSLSRPVRRRAIFKPDELPGTTLRA
jgi:TctA family transporter